MPQTSDFDGPWKDILEAHFKEFTELFLPQAAADIDWSQPPVFLDKEIQSIAPRGAMGRRIVDKLVRVKLNSGEEARVLVHVEVQASPKPDVSKRMYVYNYRCFDRYQQQVASVLVLLDDHPSWRPGSYSQELWGTRLRLEFPVIKLSDWESRREELEKSSNPFATVVLAQLEARRAGNEPAVRLESKWTLVRRLLEKDYGRKEIDALFRFIDGLIALPEELEIEFRDRCHRHQEHAPMPYVTSIERLARREGREEGLEKGLEKGVEKGTVSALRSAILEFLEARFGRLPRTLPQALGELTDPARLKVLVRDAAQAGSLTDFEARLVSRAAVRGARVPKRHRPRVR